MLLVGRAITTWILVGRAPSISPTCHPTLIGRATNTCWSLSKYLNHEGVGSALAPRILREPVAAPDLLDDVAKKEWESVCRVLVNLKVLTWNDLPALEVYCASYSAWKLAQQAWAEDGRIFYLDDGRPHPLVQQIRQLQQSFIQAAVQFGLTPASRPKMGVLDESERDEDDSFFS